MTLTEKWEALRAAERLAPSPARHRAHERAVRALDFVRYTSPFGSPAWMPREEAEGYYREDDSLWLLLVECDALTTGQREHGAPRIVSVPR